MIASNPKVMVVNISYNSLIYSWNSKEIPKNKGLILVDGFVKKLYLLKNFRIRLETSWNIIQCEMGVRIRNVIGRLILVRSFVCFTTFTVPRGHDFFALFSLGNIYYDFSSKQFECWKFIFPSILMKLNERILKMYRSRRIRIHTQLSINQCPRFKKRKKEKGKR